MRRRVIELYEGRVVRDEVSGGYTEESTTEFGLRMRAEMGVGPRRGPDQRPRPRARCSDVAPLLLHPGGVPRPAPQRRPEPGRGRHHGRHRDPARRPDPDLPDRPRPRATRSAASSSSRSRLYDDATKAEIAALQERSSTAIPHVESVDYITKGEALKTLQEPNSKDKSIARRAAHATRCRPASRSRPDDAANLPRSETRVMPTGAERQAERRSRPIIDNASSRQQPTQQDRAGDRAP